MGRVDGNPEKVGESLDNAMSSNNATHNRKSWSGMGDHESGTAASQTNFSVLCEVGISERAENG